MINKENGNGQKIAEPFLGDTCDEGFRKQTFDRIVARIAPRLAKRIGIDQNLFL